MTVIRTQDLSGKPMDYVIAQLEDNWPTTCSNEPTTELVESVLPNKSFAPKALYQPTQNAELLVLLIKKYKISINFISSELKCWRASGVAVDDLSKQHISHQDFHLAVLQCIVLCQVGTMVHVPEEFAAGITNAN